MFPEYWFEVLGARRVNCQVPRRSMSFASELVVTAAIKKLVTITKCLRIVVPLWWVVCRLPLD
jgi:hypothetical protein